MADYILEIAENDRHISVQRGLVTISAEKNLLGSVPIDTIGAVLLSADGISCSKHFLMRMGEENIPVIICDKSYMPVSIALPVSAHYKHLPVARSQMEASPVLKKQLWQDIIVCKIRNQAHVLNVCHPSDTKNQEKIMLLAGRVRSGDTDNKEGQAARLYWPALMGKHFIRDSDVHDFNIFLNYGYALIRAAMARALCAAGLLPLLGIHHHNVYNAFALVDDLIEPLRPYIDLHLFPIWQREKDNFTELLPLHKKQITQFVRIPLAFCGEKHSLASITNQMAQGLVRSLTSKVPMIPLPKLG